MMYKKFIKLLLVANIVSLQTTMFAQDNKIHYLTYKDVPGYNTGVQEVDHKFDGVTPILFTPNEDPVTGDDSNKDLKGYFWDIKDPDKTLTYPGKARIGNSQYINVVAVDSKKINTEGDSNSAVSTNSEDLFRPTDAQKKLFDDNFLVPIGTFMKPGDKTIYTVFGQYLSTVLPDPRSVGTTGPNGSVTIVNDTVGDVAPAA